MRHALRLAQVAADNNEVPVGAIVVLGGELVGEGYNQTISRSDPTAHAEIMALRCAGAKVGNHRLVGADVFVTIEPCSMCAGAMVHARIRTLYYGATEPRSGAAGSSIDVLSNQALNHKVAVKGGICAAQATALMKNFFQLRRR
ncbi:MAG: tRNA adenosine(34) deaminase TadA [Pseudomonadales bacterium]